MKDLSIKVTIANRVYPLTVQENEEENIRKAVKEINEMLRDYEQNYAVKDKQDLLAMCALQFGTKKIDLEQHASLQDAASEEKLKALEKFVDLHL